MHPPYSGGVWHSALPGVGLGSPGRQLGSWVGDSVPSLVLLRLAIISIFLIFDYTQGLEVEGKGVDE